MIDGEPYVVALNEGEIKDLQAHKDLINVAVKIDFLEPLTSK